MPNVLSPRDIVSRPDIDETVLRFFLNAGHEEFIKIVR